MSAPALSDAAQRELAVLLQQIARSIAHEANNLLFIEEIVAKTPAAARGHGDLRRGIEHMRQDARLLSQALGGPGKPTAVAVGTLIDLVALALGKQSSLRDAVRWAASDSVRALRFQERPGHAQIVMQRLCEHNAARAVSEGARYGVAVDADDDAITFTMRAAGSEPAPQATALARELAARGGLELREDEAEIRLLAPLA